MRVAPRVRTSSEARSGGPPVHKCGVDATQQLGEQVGGTTPAMLNYMLSAMDTGMGYAVASFESSQRFAMDNAHAVLDSTENHANDSTGKHSKSGAHAKHNGRHAVNRASAPLAGC